MGQSRRRTADVEAERHQLGLELRVLRRQRVGARVKEKLLTEHPVSAGAGLQELDQHRHIELAVTLHLHAVAGLGQIVPVNNQDTHRKYRVPRWGRGATTPAWKAQAEAERVTRAVQASDQRASGGDQRVSASSTCSLNVDIPAGLLLWWVGRGIPGLWYYQRHPLA